MTVDRLLRIDQVSELVALKRAAIYQYMAEGTFPRPVKIGKRAVAWRESDIQEWIRSRVEAAGDAA
ncbi:MAG: AlpA family transcriptional regulator [Acidobacteria bacterium]|nr:AlpA family transcriptional regulator [Acidobacteriota bacterium]